MILSTDSIKPFFPQNAFAPIVFLFHSLNHNKHIYPRLFSNIMKSKTEYLTFNTPTRRAFVNITPNVRKLVEESGIKESICPVNPKSCLYYAYQTQLFTNNFDQYSLVSPTVKLAIKNLFPGTEV